MRKRDEIIDIIADIYEEYKICKLGFDLEKFCQDAGIILVPYSSYEEKMSILINKYQDGFNIINPYSNACEIYYNDFILPKQRIKFTIPHEIGHIMLGHNQTFENETDEQKKEADIFANEFYCPLCLIDFLDISTSSKLISTFGITLGYADVLLDKLERKRMYKNSASEERLIDVFINNINIGKK